MAEKPKNIWLEGLFYQEGKDTQGLKKRMAHAWSNVHRKDKGMLGRKNCVALEPYTYWVKERARELKMPYAYEKPMSPVLTIPRTIPIENIEENQEALAKMKVERDTWENKYNVANAENMKLKKELKEKEDLLFLQDGWLIEKDDQLRLKNAEIEQYVIERQKEQKVHKYSDVPPTSGASKNIIDKLVVENAQLKSFHESQKRKLKRKYQHGVEPSSYEIP
ncbi:hypothetical protein L195_g019233 [Trifolium pratense]|uniref:DUF7745 domain-containing protein n=1 Tax=Trifolium pratense TaxID=57577 RepID=A0A2K3MZ31_TRIPR|nr:hypothetical protein L195_g019233 [Trifolium pratense]